MVDPFDAAYAAYQTRQEPMRAFLTRHGFTHTSFYRELRHRGLPLNAPKKRVPHQAKAKPPAPRPAELRPLEERYCLPTKPTLQVDDPFIKPPTLAQLMGGR